jgi:hypothetical protein
MPRQHYPGQYTFHILDDKAKQARRRSKNRMQMAKQREIFTQTQYSNHIISEETMTELALERYIKSSNFHDCY